MNVARLHGELSIVQERSDARVAVRRREIEHVAVDGIERARGLGGELAIDEPHLAAEVGAFERAETRLGVDNQARGFRVSVERGRLASGRTAFGEINAAFEDCVLQSLPGGSRRSQRLR